MARWSISSDGQGENGKPNPFNLNQQLGGENIVEEPVKEAPECMNDVVKISKILTRTVLKMSSHYPMLTYW